MAEPWFDAMYYAWIPGTLLGLLGGILGPLGGYFATKGRRKGLVIGMYATVAGFSAMLLLAGIVAYFVGQPYGVWYGLAMAGLIGTIIFGSLTPVLLAHYREAEMRQSQARDL
jgi:cytochrome c biogenesis protein CcdA